MQKYTVITGASAGIGHALALEFAKNKRNLILVARRFDELVTLANHLKTQYHIKAVIYATDLTHSKEREGLFNYIKEKKLEVDTLINNAGFGLNGAFIENSFQRESEMIELNITALVHLSKLFLKHLGTQKGKLVQVASIAAFFPGPFMSVYYATKAFVLSFSKALRVELSKTNCTVSVLCPGPTLSEFQKVAGMNQSNLFKSKLSPVMSSESVASYTFKKLKKNQFLIIPGFLNKVSIYLSSIIPQRVTDALIRYAHGTQ